MVNVTRNTVTSDYRALQLQYNRRLSRRLQALASYSLARSLDNFSNDAVTANPPAARIDPQLDRGPSDFDVRHAFNAAATYNLPSPKRGAVTRGLLGGWAVDTILTARSATPINVVVSRNLGFGSYPFRPDLIPDIPLFLNDPTAPGGRRINNTRVASSPRQVGPFFIPTDNRQGTLGRNALRGFLLLQLDLTVRRQFNLTERVNLQFRADFFNIFNHPNFGDPINSLGSATATSVTVNSSFGVSTQMLGRSLGSGGTEGGFNPLFQVGGPRSAQLSLKLQF